jgi:hypothetical protein
MLAVIEEVELEDQETARVVVSYDDKFHTLVFAAEDLLADDVLHKIRRALQTKLQIEKDTADLVGQGIDFWQKVYG